MAKAEDIFSKNLKYWINKRGLTQAKFADQLGVSAQQVSNYVNGINIPKLSRIGQICDILKISKDDLLSSKKDSKAIYQDDNFTVLSPTRRLKPYMMEFLYSSLMTTTEPDRDNMIRWIQENVQTETYSGKNRFNFDEMNDEQIERLYHHFKDEENEGGEYR